MKDEEIPSSSDGTGKHIYFFYPHADNVGITHSKTDYVMLYTHATIQ